MAKNPFFEQGDPHEQDMLQSLNVEAIEIYGQMMVYLPRSLNNPDKIYGADDISSFDRAYPVEMYITSWEGFQGDQVFLSKFGLEIRDRVTFAIARRTFEKVIGEDAELPRPREGDLVYFPLNKKCFEIKFVDYKPFFYQLSDLQTYGLVCELYEYSSEVFNTGIPEIDALQKEHSLNILDWGLKDDEGNYLMDENGDYLTLPGYDIEEIDRGADDVTIQRRGDEVIDFSEDNPFSESEPY